jgi:hypothetical protein
MAVTWITPAGDLGTVTERNILTIQLTATSAAGPLSYTVIAGQLPRGLRLESATGLIQPADLLSEPTTVKT